MWSELDSKAMEWIENEIRKCRSDFEYAAGNYFWLRQTKTAKSELFTMWESQQMLWDIVQKMWREGRPAWIIIHKGRQVGASTFVEGLMAWKNLFFTQQVSMILAQNPEHAAYMFGQLQYHLAHVPWWMQPAITAFERKEVLILANDGSLGEGEDGLENFIVANGANKMSSFGQGKPLHNVHCTELSTYRPASRAREIIEGDMQNALVDAPGCFAILESKPNGVGNYWHRLWNYYYSKLGKGQFYPLYIPSFFETSRRKKAPQDFSLTEDEKKLRERYAMEWHRCDNCGKPVPTYCQTSGVLKGGPIAKGEPEPELVSCVGCGSLKHSPIFLEDDQLYWYRVKRTDAEEKGKESLKKFLQEMSVTPEEGFQASGIQVFPDDVYRYVQSVARPGIRGEFDEDCRFHYGKKCVVCGENHEFDDYPLQVWELPQEGAKYVAGVDVAYGDEEGDYSVIHMIRIGYGFGNPDKQVLEWRGHIPAGELAQVCYLLGKAYNWCKMSIEAHGSGDVTQWELFSKMQYPGELFRWKHYDSSSRITTNKLGWWTNFQTKKMLVTNGIRWLRQKIWEVRSPEFLFEMPTFTKDYDDPDVAGGAVRGMHDDCIMAGLIAIFTAHDVDFDPETSRINIPESRLETPSSTSEKRTLWTCTCSCGNKWDTADPQADAKQKRPCSQCGKYLDWNAKKKRTGPPKAYVEAPESDDESTAESVGSYMEL